VIFTDLALVGGIGAGLVVSVVFVLSLMFFCVQAGIIFSLAGRIITCWGTIVKGDFGGVWAGWGIAYNKKCCLTEACLCGILMLEGVAVCGGGIGWRDGAGGRGNCMCIV